MSERLKRSFDSLEEAMAALPKSTFDHSKRVGSYMRILFMQACNEEDFYPNDPKAQARLKEDYAELAYQIGYYHDIGKAMIPEEYHNFSSDFSAEERALYEKHTGDSMAMIEKFYRQQTQCKPYEENYVREAIAFHHEMWNGTGFPNRLSGKNIPIFARMLALADTLDHMFCETLSEHPFEDVVAAIIANADGKFDPLLIPVFEHCYRKMKKVFNKDIENTRTIPSIISFVPDKENRPYAVWFRPVEDRTTGKEAFVEADIRFKGSKLWLEYGDLDELIRREKLANDLGTAAVLEACDAIRRFDVCGIQNSMIAVSLPFRWFNGNAGAASAVLTALKESYVDPARFCIVVGKEDFREARANLLKNLRTLREAGVRIMLDQLILEDVPLVAPQENAPTEEAGAEAKPAEQPVKIVYNRKKQCGLITVAEILEIAPWGYRIGSSDATQEFNDAYVNALKQIGAGGTEMLAKGVEAREHQGLLYDLNVKYVSGESAGEAARAKDYVKAEIALMS